MVSNYMEHVVEEILTDMMKNQPSMFACKCEECCDSIRAIVLNNIKPFYVTRKVGEVYGAFQNKEFQGRADVAAEIARAALIVNENPKHEK